MKKVKEVTLSILLQYAVIFLAIGLFTVGLKLLPATFVTEPLLVNGEKTSPGLNRAVYMCLSFVLALVLLKLAEKTKPWPAFFMANLGGVLLWQSVGECAWHFGSANMEVMQGSAWMLLTLLLLLYACRKKLFDWNLWVFILSFMANWFTHFVMEATFPLAPVGMTAAAWYKLSGLTAAGVLLVVVLLFAKRFKTTKENLIFSQLIFIPLAFLPGALGFI